MNPRSPAGIVIGAMVGAIVGAVVMAETWEGAGVGPLVGAVVGGMIMAWAWAEAGDWAGVGAVAGILAGAVVGAVIGAVAGIIAAPWAVVGAAVGTGAWATVRTGRMRLINRQSSGRQVPSTDPESSIAGADDGIAPQLAEKLILLFTPHSEGIPLIGDLEEEFTLIVQDHGARFARLWYWRQALSSMPSLLKWRLARVLPLVWMLEHFQRWFKGS